MNKFFSIFLLLFLATTRIVYCKPGYTNIVSGIMHKYLKEQVQHHDLVLSGYGGAMMGDVQKISINFFSYKTLSIEQARELYVELMEQLISEINTNPRIRPYLHNFPFDTNNLRIKIRFLNANALTRRDGNVALLGMGAGCFIYYDAYDETKKFYSLYEEPYEEALRKVRGCGG